MTPKDAAIMVFRILAVTPTKTQMHEVMSFMGLLIDSKGEVHKSSVKEEKNDIKPEDNTINLQEVDHFEFPKEFNIQMEGDEDNLRKVKIFPDGVSEEPAAKPATN